MSQIERELKAHLAAANVVGQLDALESQREEVRELDERVRKIDEKIEALHERRAREVDIATDRVRPARAEEHEAAILHALEHDQDPPASPKVVAEQLAKDVVRLTRLREKLARERGALEGDVARAVAGICDAAIGSFVGPKLRAAAESLAPLAAIFQQLYSRFPPGVHVSHRGRRLTIEVDGIEPAHAQHVRGLVDQLRDEDQKANTPTKAKRDEARA